MDQYYGQAQQDKFVLNMLNHKKDGLFLEIGSSHPIEFSNTFLLEKKYNWRGIMVEYNSIFLPSYKKTRDRCLHVINDATKVDYKSIFEKNNLPTNMDYLQIDLDAHNGSTLRTLEKLDRELFDKHKFATVTFEHDIYHSNFDNTREKSRKIFDKRGYIRIFEDINNEGANPYEDWYVHPELIDMNLIQAIKNKNMKHYKPIKAIQTRPNRSNLSLNLNKNSNYNFNQFVNHSINWQDIEY